MKKLFVFILLTVVAIACSTSPRGRKVLKLVPDDELNSMGDQAFNDMKTKVPIEKSAAINNYVKCIVAPLTAHAVEVAPEGGWEVVVFKEDSPNAFALPGGKIGVHTGILKVAQTPDQLAAVIGHEIGHVWAGHSNERVSENLGASALMMIGSSFAKKGDEWLLLLGSFGIQGGFLLPHSRAQESEADVLGLDLMARAGFDPNQAVNLWENMKAQDGGSPPEFLSTHPAPDTRIQNIRDHIPEFMPKYQAATPTRCAKL